MRLTRTVTVSGKKPKKATMFVNDRNEAEGIIRKDSEKLYASMMRQAGFIDSKISSEGDKTIAEYIPACILFSSVNVEWIIS
jgi:hypothetical protein